jgi:DNA primase
MDILDKLLQHAPQLADGLRQGPGHVMVRCPYHAGGREKTPSMSISTWKPVYMCHGCKAAGHLSQLFRTFGLSRDAIELILPRGKEVYEKEASSVAAKMLKGIDPFRGKFILNEEILDFYRLMPVGLHQAGFEVDTLRHFEVGFDTKNVRVTFPLRTVFGELVGISGRTAIEGVEPRYKIYDRELKERPDFRVPEAYSMEEVKSAVLWHAHVVRPMFFLQNTGKQVITVTEGFKACMWTWQSGVEDVVALVGSYLTPTHAELLARATRKVTLFLDNNEAGWKGTRKAGRSLLRKGVEVCVAKYPDEREQPDDLSPQEVLQAIEQPESFLRWSLQHPEPEPIRKLLKRIVH